jgi:rhodanese-related sulfurtransferase
MFSALIAKITGRAAPLPTIADEDFARVVENHSCAIVDVREPHEYAAGHVPGARNLPLSGFDASQLPKGDVVLICQAGGRSAKALTQALQAGRKDVRHYQPGTSGWRARGGALEA